MAAEPHRIHPLRIVVSIRCTPDVPEVPGDPLYLMALLKESGLIVNNRTGTPAMRFETHAGTITHRGHERHVWRTLDVECFVYAGATYEERVADFAARLAASPFADRFTCLR